MKKVSFVQLQKKYSGKIVALSKSEDKVIAASKNILSLFSMLKKKGYDKKNIVFVGPLEKYGTIRV